MLRLGVSGLGRGAVLTLPGLASHERISIAAAFDPDPDARAGFEAVHGAATYDSFDALCAHPAIDALYIASPHEHHASQAIAAARAGKHVLVEKPMAVDLADAQAMIDAARSVGTVLMVGPSHGYDPPVALAAQMIASGRFGRARMVQALNYTDFLYRPRRPEELDSARGGGVVLSQATHQIDMVRRLIGAPVATVRARLSGWDETRGRDGAFSALLTFDGGAWVSLTYNGYGRWDSDLLTGGIGEMGIRKSPATPPALAQPADDPASKRARGFGGEAGRQAPPPPEHHEHFGFLLVSCERADLEIGPDGVTVHGSEDPGLHRPPLPPAQRHAVAEALVGAILDGQEPLFDGEWGLQTLACCHAILQSSAADRDVSPAGLLRNGS